MKFMSPSPVTQDKMIAMLKSMYPKGWFKDGAEFGPEHEGQVWSGEGAENNEGLLLFEYYADDPPEKDLYEMGVLKELSEFLSKHGWHAEFHDPGTVFLSQE